MTPSDRQSLPVSPAAGGNSASAWAEYSTPDGRIYYYNRETRVTKWEKPDEFKSQLERNSVWKEYAKDGRAYWFNIVTKKSTWTRPDELGGPEPKEAPNQQASSAMSNAEMSPATRLTSMSILAPVSATPPVALQPIPEHPPVSIAGPRSLLRPPPPVPPVKALESMRPARREYKTLEEAEQAFFNILKAHKVGGDWTWEQTLRAVVNDADYRALKTTHERKEAFHKYIDKAREEEREQRLLQQKQRRESYFAMLDTLPISEFTRFKKIQHMAKELPAFIAVPTDTERGRLFDEYLEQRVRSLKEIRRRARNEKMSEVEEYLKDLSLGSKWADVKVELVDRFQKSLMPILRVDSCPTHLPLDHLYVLKDADTADPELGLSMLDLMDAFERAILDAEKRDSEIRQKDKDAARRRERQARDGFRKLLDEHRSDITPTSTWTEFYPLIKSDPRYIGMLGEPGSTPLELFWDKVELLNEDVYRERRRLETVMRDHGFRMQVDTPLADVQQFAADKHCSVTENYMEHVYQQLVEKAKRRKDEEEERALRHRRRLLDDFKYALYDLVPPLEIESKWDSESSRIGRLPEYRDVNDPQACQGVFDQAIIRLVEKQEQRKKRRDMDSRKRSRSPNGYMSDASVGAPAKGLKVDRDLEFGVKEAGFSSELEEGEMII
ncbi:U1 snRNP protein [Kickxella alabastrina]|uniref:U1 snRNP protein n=1 Tax=Kickxella alabastrina TaxID=61397 RepID=A0ACC1INW0_9FUNG|nr:U1 snRNP protein [Kickxella alabastrina]